MTVSDDAWRSTCGGGPELVTVRTCTCILFVPAIAGRTEATTDARTEVPFGATPPQKKAPSLAMALVGGATIGTEDPAGVTSILTITQLLGEEIKQVVSKIMLTRWLD